MSKYSEAGSRGPDPNRSGITLVFPSYGKQTNGQVLILWDNKHTYTGRSLKKGSLTSFEYCALVSSNVSHLQDKTE